jgi:hypothetical protein
VVVLPEPVVVDSVPEVAEVPAEPVVVFSVALPVVAVVDVSSLPDVPLVPDVDVSVVDVPDVDEPGVSAGWVCEFCSSVEPEDWFEELVLPVVLVSS